MEPPSLVLPFIYDISSNITQLADKNAASVPGVVVASQLLKQFMQFQSNMTECSIFPAIRELLFNLVLPTDPQQPNTVVPQQMQSPAMQMGQVGQPGYPVNMPMGMIG